MKKSPLPPILVSTLPPGTYSLAGEVRTVVCPTCKAWTRVRKGAMWPHDNDQGATCVESRRSVWFDLDAQQEAAGRLALELAGRHAAQRRSAPTHSKPTPPPLASMPHMAQDRERDLTWTRHAERAESEARYWDDQATQSHDATRRQDYCRETASARRSDAAYWRAQLQRHPQKTEQTVNMAERRSVETSPRMP